MTQLLLIHGAWQGAWAWDYLVPELTSRGHVCHAVNMPGNGNGEDATPPGEVSLDLYMNFLKDELYRIGENMVVVGHSSGGIISSQLAENEYERIIGIVYVAGMMLPSGMGYADLVEELMPSHPEVAGIIPYLEWSDDIEQTIIAEGAAQNIFFQDCSRALANEASAKLNPHPERGRAIKAMLTEERFGQLPRAYIEATLDQSVVPAAQKRMQELMPGAIRYSLETGHAPQLSAPVQLANVIDQAVKDFS